MEYKFYVGTDVSKEKLDVAVWSDTEWVFTGTVKNTRKDALKLLREMKKRFGLEPGNALFCMEHTGVYAMPLVSMLNQHQHNIWLESARQIKNSLGMQRGKSDQVDAKRIAEYAYRFRDKMVQWQPAPELIQQLKEMLVARERLIKARKQFEVALHESKQFMESSLYRIHQQASKGPIREIRKSITQIEEQIEQLLNSTDDMKRLYSLVKSVEGIGVIIASHLIVVTNRFTAFSDPRKFASFCGVAPFEHTSGSSIRGKTRVSHLADKGMKTLLHLSAVSCIKQGGEMARYYQRKVDEGKHKMSVINAMRNKIIQRVFAVVNRGTPYQKNFVNALA